MKKILLPVLLLSLFSMSVMADTFVRGHFRSNGTYVTPHYRSNSNKTKLDNFSTKGNFNPYTGKKGTKKIKTFSYEYDSLFK